MTIHGFHLITSHTLPKILKNVSVINRHKGKCNSLIFILQLYLFLALKTYYGQNKLTVFIVLNFVKALCDTGKFLLYTVIIMTSFIWVQHRFFVNKQSSCVSALFWYNNYYGSVYIIYINTHDLILCLYNICFRTL